ncbi:hypothetical protein SOVF_149230, partial [Spinacia oleracea]
MGDGNGKNGKKVQLIHDASSIYYLHPSEGPSNSLTKYMLKNENFDIWEKAIINALEGRNKFGFVNGEFEKPTDETSAEFSAWKSNNSTICSWMFNSIDESIQPSVAGHKIAREMWLDFKERYSNNNGPRLNQLKAQYHLLRQTTMSVVSYYNRFKALWDELYGSEDLTCGCTCAAAAKLCARVERDKTHDFVLGLDDEQYSNIRTQILTTTVTPATNNLSSQVTTTTNSAPPTCSFCGRFGHDYDRCYQRVGFPPKSGRGGRGGRGSRSRGGASGGRGQQTQVSANAARVPHQQPANDATTSSTSRPANNDSSPTGFTTEQMQRLITLLESSSASEKLFGKEINLDCLWLLDSGASHHMTGMLDNLYDCSAVPPCPVSLPDDLDFAPYPSSEATVPPTTIPTSPNSTDRGSVAPPEEATAPPMRVYTRRPRKPSQKHAEDTSVRSQSLSPPASPSCRLMNEDGAVLATAPSSPVENVTSSVREPENVTVPNDQPRVRRPPN